MSDLLLEIARHRTARQVVRTMGLPIPLPQPLERAQGAWKERPLHDQVVVVGADEGAHMASPMALALAQAGAIPHLLPHETLPEAFAGPGEAYGRLPVRVTAEDWPEKLQAHALVFDGSSLASTADLKELYTFLHDLLPRLRRNGRVVVLNRPLTAVTTAQAAAIQAALVGMIRSLSKEIGRKGSTANLLTVTPGSEGYLAGPLRFLLSRRSAFVTGQPLSVANTYRPQPQLPWQLPLDNAVALVTGAARGIGAATARRLAAEGAHVFCLDRPEDSALVATLAREIGGTAILADMRNPETPARIVHDVKATQDHLDIVVHNAGVTRDKTLARMSEQAWTETLDVNLSAIMAVDEVLVPDLLADQGRIICLASIAGIAGNAGQTNYAASKAGLMAYVEHQGRQLESRGITVNAVAPGFIETRMTAAVPLAIRQAGRRLSSLGQGGLPLDVAEVITFLASPGAQGMTGTTIRVCGGALLGA